MLLSSVAILTPKLELHAKRYQNHGRQARFRPHGPGRGHPPKTDCRDEKPRGKNYATGISILSGKRSQCNSFDLWIAYSSNYLPPATVNLQSG